MKNKLLKAAAMCLLTAMISAGVCACGVDYTQDELKSTAAALIEASYEVNEIYFGKGLPTVDPDSDTAQDFADGLDVDIASVNYLPVTEDCPYQDTRTLKELAAAVYTQDYCEYLYKMAFEGVSAEDGTSAVYARYIFDYTGVLTVRADLEETGFELNRTYDTENITVERMRKNEAVVSVKSLVDEKEDLTIRLTLKREADGWRLDDPTY